MGTLMVSSRAGLRPQGTGFREINEWKSITPDPVDLESKMKIHSPITSLRLCYLRSGFDFLICFIRQEG